MATAISARPKTQKASGLEMYLLNCPNGRDILELGSDREALDTAAKLRQDYKGTPIEIEARYSRVHLKYRTESCS